MSRTRLIVRGVAASRCVAGIALLLRPRASTDAVSAHRPSPPSWIVRLLGVRMLAQSAAVLIRPDRDVVGLGAAVDSLHGLSMLAAAVIWPDHRRLALASAGDAGVSAVVAAASVPRLP